MNEEPTTEDAPPAMKTFVVAVRVCISTPGKHWFSAGRTIVSLCQYKIDAPTEESAKALAIDKTLCWACKKYPNSTNTDATQSSALEI